MNRILLRIAGFMLLSSALVRGDVVMGSKAMEIRDRVLARGLMTLRFSQGWIVPVIAEGVPAGFVFYGSGKWEARATDPFALQVLPYNVKHGSHLKADGGVLGDEFTGAMCIGTEAVSWIREEGTSPGESCKGVFDKIYGEFLDQFFSSPVTCFLAGLLNGTQEFSAMILGKSDDLMFHHDPVWSQNETLSALEQSTFTRKGRSNLYWYNQLVNQPPGRTFKTPATPPAVLTQLDYDFDLTDPSAWKGTYRLKLKVLHGGIQHVPLALVNARVYFSSGESDYGVGLGDFETLMSVEGVDRFISKSLIVDHVFGADGAPLSYNHAGDFLTVDLPRPAETGDILELAVNAHGRAFEPTPEMGPYQTFIGTDWFPSPPGAGQGAGTLFNGRVVTKKPWIALGAYASSTIRTDGETQIIEGTNTRPENYHTLAVGKYFPKESETGGLKITVASQVFPNKRAYDLLFGLSGGVLDTYKLLLGAFPFDHLQVLEGRGVGYGQSSPYLVFASEEIFNSMKDTWNQFFSRGANERFAHEIAHQYFGHAVKAKLPEEQWMTEALAEYMAAEFLGRAKGKSEFKYIYAYWYNRGKEASSYASPFAANHLGGHDADRYAWDLTYCKGPAVFQAIRDHVGDKMFWTILRSFLRSFPYKPVTTQDLIGLMNYITKEDWQPFFDKYVYGTEYPPKSELK